MIQSLALAYGCYVISEQRPAIITFVGDRFEIITFSEGLHQNLSSRAKDTGAPPFITYALPAQTEEEKSKFIIDNYQYKYEAVRHKPIDQFIAVLSKAKLDMSNFKFASAEKEAGFQTFISSHQDKNFALFALEGTRNVAIVIAIDLDKKRVLEYLEIDPWVEYLPSMNNT